MRYSRFLIFVVVLGLLPKAVLAQVFESSSRNSLVYIDDTLMLDGDGDPLALCLSVRTRSVMFLNMARRADYYVLAEDACKGRVIPFDNIQDARDAGLIPPDIPQEPSLPLIHLIIGHLGVVISIGIALVSLIRLRVKRADKLSKRDPLSRLTPAA